MQPQSNPFFDDSDLIAPSDQGEGDKADRVAELADRYGDDSPGKPRKKREQPRKLRKISAEYFRRAAIYYLDRYNGTSQSVRQLLKRRVMRAKKEGQELDDAQIDTWISELLADLQRLGLINDSNFAIGRARSLHASGQSLSMIRMKLRAKGIGSEDIDQAIERLRDEAGEDIALEAARTYVRKRRLGWHRPEEQRDERRDKDLAALARHGFGYDVATAALEEPEE